MVRRQFNFLRHYAGEDDPLGQAVKLEAERRGVKVCVTSDEKIKGKDLLEQEPYNSEIEKARQGWHDGYHSGVPVYIVHQVEVA